MNFPVTKQAFLDELTKIAATRSVKEWRSATAAGDHGTADSIAQASGNLGLKPRYLHDISMGGAEAGVDKMMGRATNPQTGETNASGYAARKLYKPDSHITRAEFTPQLLQQKQEYANAARAMSPEAKAMVPNMYGHQTMNAQNPALQRTTSLHEFVPGVRDIRGKNTGTADKPIWSDRSGGVKATEAVRKNVLMPMQDRGTMMGDVISDTGTNYGNLVQSPQGPKALDFVPQDSLRSGRTIAEKSFAKYAPTETKFQEGKSSLQSLRKEVFKPQMQINPASGAAQAAAEKIMATNDPHQTPDQSMATAPRGKPLTRPTVAPPTAPQVAAPAPAVNRVAPLGVHSDPFPARMPMRAPTSAPMRMPMAAAAGALRKPGIMARVGSLFH